MSEGVFCWKILTLIFQHSKNSEIETIWTFWIRLLKIKNSVHQTYFWTAQITYYFTSWNETRLINRLFQSTIFEINQEFSISKLT